MSLANEYQSSDPARSGAEVFNTENGLRELAAVVQVARHNKKGIELAAQRKFLPACAEFDLALKLCPTFAEAWFHRGLVLQDLHRIDDAYNSFAQAVLLTPGYEAAERNLAGLAAYLGHPAQILTPWMDDPVPSRLARRWRKIRAAIGWNEPVQYEFERSDESVLRQELLNRPTDASAAVSLGRHVQGQGRHIEAECFFRYALKLEPWNGEAASRLSMILEQGPRFLEVIDIVRSAMTAGATDARLPSLGLWNALKACDWSDHADLLDATLKALFRDPRSTAPLATLCFIDEPKAQWLSSVAFSKVVATGCAPLMARFACQRRQPLTIGYVSADLHDHPVARLIVELFELHDRSRFKIHGYSLYLDTGTPFTRRVRGSFDKLVDLFGLFPRPAAEKILGDNVDILINLTGNTLYSPTGIMKCRPAPLQVNYLGYPGTLGMSEVDYAFVDHTIVSPGQDQWYSEKLVYLPDCYQVNDRKRQVGSRKTKRSDFDLPDDAVVYCNFNELRKVTPEGFRVWMRILQQVPGSVLWLFSTIREPVENLRREAAQCGVDPRRLIFAGKLPNDEHLSRYRHADLFLDTFLYNAHTTASDALWVGCPVLTLLGKTFPARVAGSILRAAGLPELVTTSLQEYEQLAVRLGLDTAFRERVRAKLANSRDTCALFDTERFTRQFEWALEHMWERYSNGHNPASFDVPSLKNL